MQIPTTWSAQLSHQMPCKPLPSTGDEETLQVRLSARGKTLLRAAVMQGLRVSWPGEGIGLRPLVLKGPYAKQNKRA